MHYKKIAFIFFAFSFLINSLAQANYYYDYDYRNLNPRQKELVETLNNGAVVNALQTFLIRLKFLPDPNQPSIWRKISETTGQIAEKATEDLRDKVQKGEIKPGEALHKMAMAIATTGKEIGMAFLPLIGSLAAIGVAAYGAKRGFDVLKEWYIKQINTPQLLKAVIEPWHIKRNFGDLHYTGDTKKQVHEIIHMAKAVAQSAGSAKFENVMLWGPPGTGKTAIIEIIAKEAGMTVFKTTGGDFAKLKGKDLEQIDQIFKLAKSNGKSLINFGGRPVLFFIDEMEHLFGSRARDTLSEDARNVLSKLLEEFSEPNSKIMLIGATNRPEDLDEAMHRRMPQQIEVGLPDHDGRVEILKIYKRKMFDEDKNYTPEIKKQINAILSDKMLKTMATQTGSIAPAELENIMNTLKNRSWMYNKGMPNKELITNVIDLKLKQLEARKNNFKRSEAPNDGTEWDGMVAPAA